MTQVQQTPQAPQIPGVPGTQQAPQTPQAPVNTSVTTGNNGNTGNYQNKLDIVGRVNFPATQLFEATGFIDLEKQFPTANAFLLFVPGVQDQSKASGRTYDQSRKETMKVNLRDLYALAEALDFAAKYQQCDFTVFTDSSKFAGTQGQGVTKKVTVTAMTGNNGKPRVFLSYSGQGKINLALDKWHAVGLAGQLKALADRTQNEKFKIEREKASQYHNS